MRRKSSEGSDSINIIQGMKSRTEKSPLLWICSLFVGFDEDRDR